MTDFFDSLETRSTDQRENDLFARLQSLLDEALKSSPGWQRQLKDADCSNVADRAALASLPVLRKQDLKQFQEDEPPFAGFTTGGPETWGRVFMSPGPIFEPAGTGADPWRSARALFAAGFRKGDTVHNSFAYHLTPGGFILDSGARALGCAVIPAGIGNTDMQVETIARLRPCCFTGTPDYLKVLLDRAVEINMDASSIERASVGGGALFPSLRQEYAERGVKVLQTYATADVGMIAYETEAVDGMIIEEDVIVEIVRPGTGEPVPDGEVGEVVVTNFNPVYPMIRLATGDLSAVLAGHSPCGRTNMRIKGWMGRADQTTKIKGMFVHPSQVAEIARRHAGLGRLRIEVTRADEQDVLTLKAETSSVQDDLKQALADSLRDICKLRGNIEFAEPGSLPNDGKVIDDQRQYD